VSLEKRREEEKNRVFGYVQAHPSETEDDIAAALGMDLIDVLVALYALKDEGKVVEVVEQSETQE
jgi:transcription initiation factor IIE alpha subunit